MSNESFVEDKPKKPQTLAERNAADLEKMADFGDDAEDSSGLNDAAKALTEVKTDKSNANVLKIKLKAEDIELIVSFNHWIYTKLAYGLYYVFIIGPCVILIANCRPLLNGYLTAELGHRLSHKAHNLIRKM